MTFFNFSFKIEDKNSKLLNGQDDTTKYMGYVGFWLLSYTFFFFILNKLKKFYF